MKKFFLAIITLCCAAAVNATPHTINVGEFNELVVNDGINVVYSNNADSVGIVAFDIEKEYTSRAFEGQTENTARPCSNHCQDTAYGLCLFVVSVQGREYKRQYPDAA